ncbi:RDD family protein [Haloterrigena sp. H1]|uniref:RDD family protein n=1 Tax=Haloterrigena sp. H1 TaxID=2552943 RepID=UPI001485DC8D|nr:RDD family protein [Haloterrigena sp. H1]
MKRIPSVTGSRFQALFIDHLVALSILVAIAVIGTTIITDPTTTTGFLFFSGVLYIPLFLAYKTGMEAYYGQTFGKAARGITVRQIDGSTSTLWTSLVRNLLLPVDYIPMLYLLGIYVIHRTEKGQRIGDLAADTIVVCRK